MLSQIKFHKSQQLDLNVNVWKIKLIHLILNRVFTL